DHGRQHDENAAADAGNYCDLIETAQETAAEWQFSILKQRLSPASQEQNAERDDGQDQHPDEETPRKALWLIARLQEAGAKKRRDRPRHEIGSKHRQRSADGQRGEKVLADPLHESDGEEEDHGRERG